MAYGRREGELKSERLCYNVNGIINGRVSLQDVGMMTMSKEKYFQCEGVASASIIKDERDVLCSRSGSGIASARRTRRAERATLLRSRSMLGVRELLLVVHIVVQLPAPPPLPVALLEFILYNDSCSSVRVVVVIIREYAGSKL